jgi:putative two-component system response regulator
VRPYKTAWSLDAARQFLVDNSGSHFDPQCVDALLRRWPAVLEIRDRLDDGAAKDAA